VFGVLHIAFGVIGLLGLGFTLAMYAVTGSRDQRFEPPWADHPLWKVWSFGTTVIAVVATIALIAAGIGLLRMRPWARTVSMIYASYCILMSIVASAVNFVALRSSAYFHNMGPTESTVMTVIMVGSGLLGVIYPIAIWYFMTRPVIVAAFEAQGSAQPDEPWSEPTVMHDVRSDAIARNPFAAPQVASTRAVPVGMSAAGDSVPSVLIPARNGAALSAYYLGLFSIVPILGLPLAIVALVLGVRGLRRFREDPTICGRNHAWVGIVCAVIFGGFNLLLAGTCLLGMIITLVQQ